MLYGCSDGKILTKSIEYSLAYHCNLQCSHCSHLSPFQTPESPTVQSFERDISRLTTALHAEVIRLLGGEPLLNPDIDEFLYIARESRIADRLMVTTNGLLLHRMTDAFWERVDLVLVSLYPDIHLEDKLENIRQRASRSGSELWTHEIPRFRTMMLTEQQPRDWITSAIFESCEDVHLHHCHMLHEGRLYKCAVPPFLPQYLARLGQGGYDPLRDSFDLHGAADLAQDLRDFLLSSRVPEACEHCLGYLGRIEAHSQAEREAIAAPHCSPVTREEDLDRGRLGRALSALMAD